MADSKRSAWRYWNDVLDYAERIRDGRKRACIELKQGIERFFRDLDNPEYELDHKGPEFVIGIIERTICHQQGENIDGTPLRITSVAGGFPSSQTFIEAKIAEVKKLGFDFSMAERGTLLRVVDKFWTDHIDAMNTLRNEIGVMAYGQKDPIIAYKQPVTRIDLEEIRGHDSEYPVQKLLELGVIEPVGRKDTPGKPVLYGTTDSFLKRFKLRSIKELPDYEEFLRKLADINSWEALKPADDEGYLYEKEEYNPEEDTDLTQDIPTDETSEIEE